MGNIIGSKLGLEGQTGREEAERSREEIQFGGIRFHHSVNKASTSFQALS